MNNVESSFMFEFCEGGDGQMSDLIWYSWLGGIIMGTMIGSNMAFDEVSPAGPRNVVITGRYTLSWILARYKKFSSLQIRFISTSNCN